MNFSEAMFYENYLTSDFHTNTVTSRRVCLLVKMASKTVIRPINQLNYTHTLIPSDTQSNAKVNVCVLLVVLRGCQSTKKCQVFLPRTSVSLFPHVVLLLNET